MGPLQLSSSERESQLYHFQRLLSLRRRAPTQLTQISHREIDATRFPPLPTITAGSSPQRSAVPKLMKQSSLGLSRSQTSEAQEAVLKSHQRRKDSSKTHVQDDVARFSISTFLLMQQKLVHDWLNSKSLSFAPVLAGLIDTALLHIK